MVSSALKPLQFASCDDVGQIYGTANATDRPPSFLRSVLMRTFLTPARNPFGVFNSQMTTPTQFVGLQSQLPNFVGQPGFVPYIGPQPFAVFNSLAMMPTQFMGPAATVPTPEEFYFLLAKVIETQAKLIDCYSI